MVENPLLSRRQNPQKMAPRRHACRVLLNPRFATQTRTGLKMAICCKPICCMRWWLS